jgi:hydroxyethylthiazole kinase-like uncharacterized protein yjeF
MQRITPDRRWPLFDIATTRRLERAAAAGLPPHTLMERAGLAVARLALAVAPHARTIWIACGPGNNGGDGLEAAVHLRQWGKRPLVSWLGDEATSPADARTALARARDAGVSISEVAPAEYDLAIDALLGIGARRPPAGMMAQWIARMNERPGTVLAVDVPSGLDADTGSGIQVRATCTLSLLTLKPGLFTGHGRDAGGQVWLDALGVAAPDEDRSTPSAWLGVDPRPSMRLHASHKGSFGDVVVIGGAAGMAGAALLAGSAALHGGAGRVFVGLLDPGAGAVDAAQPELMLRAWDSSPAGAAAEQRSLPCCPRCCRRRTRWFSMPTHSMRSQPIPSCRRNCGHGQPALAAAPWSRHTRWKRRDCSPARRPTSSPTGPVPPGHCPISIDASRS